MANIRKSFNFRNGVQVDDDNFIVNANGLVGIGTSIPTEFLDVHGTAKVTGLITATNLTITGVSTFYSDVNVGSGITLSPSTGAVRATTFFGDGSTLSNIVGFSTNAWILNIAQTGLSTSLNIGIGTQALDAYDLIIGSDPLVSEGISFDGSTGNINSSGIVTASGFSGNLTGNVIGNINSTGVSTFATLNVGTGVTISGGIITATTFVGSLTGTAATTTNIPNLTGAITSNNTTTSLGSFTSAQLATALSDVTGSGANVFATSPTLVTPALGNATATSIVASSGIITAFGFDGTLTGNLVGNVIGIASTALNLSGSPSITVTNINNTGVITSSNLHIGTGGVNFTALSSGKVGIGTTIPTSEFQIRKDSNSLLEVISNSGQARISIGQSVGVGKSTAVLRFGNTAKTFDIINNDIGNINTILHGGPSGVGTGRFAWLYGQTNSELASLTYDGKFGIGITNPIDTFHVVGTSTITSSSYVGDTLYVTNDIYLKTLRANIVASNTFVTSGISTFSTLYLYGESNVLGIGTNNAGGYKFKIEDNLDAYLGTKATLGTQSGTETTYFASNLSADASLLKVFGGLYARTLYVDTLSPTTLTVGTGITATSGIVTAVNGFSSGIGTAVKITTVGDRVYFTVAGVGSTSLQLF